MKVCDQCGAKYAPRNSLQRFCGKPCKQQWHEAHRYERAAACQHPDGCGRQARKVGWCEMHYQRVLAHGEPGPAAKMTLHGEPRDPVCSVPGCEEPHRAATFCSRHYKRMAAHGETGPAERLRRQVPEVRGYTLGQRHRFFKYGLTPEAFDDLLEQQGRRCYICRTPEPTAKGWCVDHCHETDVVRFILCHPCNVALGLVREDPRIAKRLYEAALECQQLRLNLVT